MNKKELQRRGKGLLALMLALIMMFGTSMTVLAATYTLDSTSGLMLGQTLNGGDTINITTNSGGLAVYIDSGDNLADYDHARTITLPEGADYSVIDYVAKEKTQMSAGSPMSEGWFYTVRLATISNPPSGGNTGSGGTGGGNAGGNTGGGSTGGSNAGGSTASPEVLEAPQTETGNGGGQPHIHTYTWVTTREATETQDGLDEYKCACGVVDTQVTVPASQVVVKGFYKAVREAAPDSKITYDTKDLSTISDKMVSCLSERTDVTVEITFIYQKTPYRMTIPAGSDYSALLADEDMFYGYFYFANQIGAQIEPVL